jgi:hypothetical protein
VTEACRLADDGPRGSAAPTWPRSSALPSNHPALRLGLSQKRCSNAAYVQCPVGKCKDRVGSDVYSSLALRSSCVHQILAAADLTIRSLAAESSKQPLPCRAPCSFPAGPKR